MTGQESTKRIQYQKPEALEIGPVAAIIGASCTTGESFSITSDCSDGSGYTGGGRAPSSRDQSDEISPDLFK